MLGYGNRYTRPGLVPFRRGKRWTKGQEIVGCQEVACSDGMKMARSEWHSDVTLLDSSVGTWVVSRCCT